MVLCCASLRHWLIGSVRCPTNAVCDKCNTPSMSMLTDTSATSYNSIPSIVTDTANSLAQTNGVAKHNGHVINRGNGIASESNKAETPDSSEFSVSPPNSGDGTPKLVVRKKLKVLQVTPIDTPEKRHAVNKAEDVMVIIPKKNEDQVVTPIAIIMGEEDALSALPPTPLLQMRHLTPEGKTRLKVKKSSSMIDKTAIWNSAVLSGLPPKRRARSMTAIDNIKSSLRGSSPSSPEPDFSRRNASHDCNSSQESVSIVSQDRACESMDEIPAEGSGEVASKEEPDEPGPSGVDAAREDNEDEDEDHHEEAKDSFDNSKPRQARPFIDIDGMLERKSSVIGVTSSGLLLKYKD